MSAEAGAGEREEGRGAAWVPALSAFGIAALQASDAAIYPLLLPLLARETFPGCNPSWMLTAYAVGAAAAPLAWSWISPARYARHGIAIGLLGLGLANLGLAVGLPFGAALLARTLAGAGSGVVSGALLIASLRLGHGALSAQTAGFLAALVAGVPGLAHLVAAHGVVAATAGLAAVSGLLLVLAARTLPRPDGGSGPARGFLGLLHEPAPRRGLAAVLVTAAAVGGVTALLPTLLQDPDRGGLDLAATGRVYLLAGLGPLLGGLATPHILRRTGLVPAARGFSLALAPVLVLLPFAVRSAAAAALLLLLALLLETTRRTALQAHLGQFHGPADQPRFLTLRALASQLGLAVAIPIFDLLLRGGRIATAAGIAALLMILGGLLPVARDQAWTLRQPRQ
jgi:predicted MFS family arabinose efflux permease